MARCLKNHAKEPFPLVSPFCCDVSLRCPSSVARALLLAAMGTSISFAHQRFKPLRNICADSGWPQRGCKMLEGGHDYVTKIVATQYLLLQPWRRREKPLHSESSPTRKHYFCCLPLRLPAGCLCDALDKSSSSCSSKPTTPPPPHPPHHDNARHDLRNMRRMLRR